MRFLFSIVLCLGAAVTVSGCNFAPYGAAAPYNYYQRGQPPVVMPANAPSITNQYRLLTSASTVHSNDGDHQGIDVLEKVGTPVLAATGGKVSRSFSGPMYGNQILVVHGEDGAGARYTTVYKHLDARSVKAGETVRRGQQIGTLGTTGLLSQGYPHLHFELWVKPKGRVSDPQDPNKYWVNGGGKVTCFAAGRRYPSAPNKLTYPVICKSR